MRLRLLPAAVALALLAAAPAGAADPVPGALYEGTTEDGNPFQFRVAPDGSAVTDLLTSISITCVGPEGGVEIKALASKTPFSISGGTISGEDEEALPRLKMDGTFASPGEASGTVLASFAKFAYGGGGLTTCMREFTWTATTAAPDPAPTPTPTPEGDGGDAGSGPAPAPPRVGEPAATVSKRARAIKRCKRIKSRKRRSSCLRRARRIRG